MTYILVQEVAELLGQAMTSCTHMSSTKWRDQEALHHMVGSTENHRRTTIAPHPQLPSRAQASINLGISSSSLLVSIAAFVYTYRKDKRENNEKEDIGRLKKADLEMRDQVRHTGGED